MRSIGAWRWMYRPLRRRSGLNSSSDSSPGQETPRLVAEFRDPLVHEGLIQLIVSVHAPTTIGGRRGPL